VALSFLYRLARRALELVRVHRMEAIAKDVEILILRHHTRHRDWRQKVLAPNANCRSIVRLVLTSGRSQQVDAGLDREGCGCRESHPPSSPG
jgi:hypothetical protein